MTNWRRREADTISHALAGASQKLKEAGIENFRSEAEILLSEIMKVPRWKLYTRMEEPLSPTVKGEFWEAVERRASRCPTAYILQRKEFYGYTFLVSPRVLIPRPETELLVDVVKEKLGQWLKKDERSYKDNYWDSTGLNQRASEPDGDSGPYALNILEMGTGSGCLAVTLALLFPQATLWAVDISADALEIARKNATRHDVARRIIFREGNFWEALASCQEVPVFQAVVSNPPYVPSAEFDKLSPEIKSHEPRLALDGGGDGLEAYRHIIEGCGKYIQRPGGLLVLEVGVETSAAVEDLCRQNSLFGSVEVIPDYANLPRVVVATTK